MIPRCSLFPDGTAVVSADVFAAADRPDRLDLEVIDGDGRTRLRSGSPIDFWLGEARVFSGVVERSGLRIDRDGARLSLVAYTAYEKRRDLRASDCYYQMSDAEIAVRIAGELGLTPRVERTLEVHRRLERHGDPLRFLRRRARQQGFELAVSAGVLHFASRLPSEGSAPRPLALGRGVLSLEVEGGREGRGGEVRILGDPAWRPLFELELTGAGSGWDGVYRVVRCRHHVDASGYHTVLGFRESGTHLVAPPVAEGRE